MLSPNSAPRRGWSSNGRPTDGAVTWWEFALRLVNLVAAGMLGGAQFFVLMTLVPAKRRRSLAGAVELHHEVLSDPADRYLRPTAVVSLVTGILLLVTYRHFDTDQTVVAIVGVASTIAMMAVAVARNFPINERVAELVATNSTSEYAELGPRWDRAHATRTVFGMLAFILLAISAILR
jgi:hypothetical protein